MKYPDQESVKLEFKAAMPKNDQVLKTVIGFCNQHGGRLVIGVADDGMIIGLSEEVVIDILEYLENAIYIATSPPIIPHVYSQWVNDKLLLIIDVSEGMNKPYFRHAEGMDKGTYIRIGRSTVHATSDMIEELKWQSRGISFEQLPIYQATPDELENAHILKFLSSRRQNQNAVLSEEILMSYRLLVVEHTRQYPSVAGILLFGKRVQYWMQEAMIICSHFKGISGREAIAAIDCNGTLFSQLEQAFHFIISRLNHSFKIEGIKREEKLEVPEIAIREIILNAIIHRNYHIRAPIKIAIFDNRIEIFSPGNFPTPLPNLHLGLTNVRNMTISKIFREAGLVEKLGTGFPTVFNAYEEWGLPEPVINDGDGFVKCILPRPGYGADASASDQEMKILQLFTQANELSVSDVMDNLHLPRSTASRKLSELVTQGKLMMSGRGKATRYSRK